MKKVITIGFLLAVFGFISCNNDDEIPITTWRTTGVHRIEVVFSDTTNWVGQCVFTAGYKTGTGKALYEDGKKLNDSTEMYIEKSLRNFNVYSEETSNIMAACVSVYSRTTDNNPLTIKIRGYVNDSLTNTATCEFLPEIKVKAIEFRTEVRYKY